MIDIIFPKRCVFCRKIMSEEENTIPVCKECEDEILTIYNCDNIHTPEFIDGIAAPLKYNGKVRSAVLRYKFYGKKSYHLLFSELMQRRLVSEYSWDFDFITWVPIGILRRFKRGFNQTELLGRQISKNTKIPCGETMKKRFFVKRQSSLSKSIRKANVLGAYKILRNADIKGKKVLLVDDVCTTGSTLSECARVLKTNGAFAVYCIILAKTTDSM